MIRSINIFSVVVFALIILNIIWALAILAYPGIPDPIKRSMLSSMPPVRILTYSSIEFSDKAKIVNSNQPRFYRAEPRCCDFQMPLYPEGDSLPCMGYKDLRCKGILDNEQVIWIGLIAPEIYQFVRQLAIFLKDMVVKQLSNDDKCQIYSLFISIG